LVLELDEISDAEKINPNQVPTGLERISYKAEEHIKTISGVPDANTGFAREDVSAKALKANQVKSSANFAMVQDNLQRTDHFMARALLDIVQSYYTEERMMFITTDPLKTKTEEFTVNEVTPEGEIAKDLTLGEYDIVVTSQPERDTLEDSTFAQAVEMRKELGVNIPDSVLIQNSRITNKSDVIEAIEAEANSEEAQQQKQLELQREQAEIGQIQSSSRRDDADTQAKQVKAQGDAQNQQHVVDPEAQLRVEADLAKSKYQVDMDAQIKREQMLTSVELKKMDLAAAALKPDVKKPAAAKPKPKKKEPKK
jgi:hypothetical protein